MIYRFNDFELDSINFRLLKNGKILAIEPQVFNLIAYLIINNDRLVTREEIFNHIWAGREVLDASLSNHIKSARSVLGDNGDVQKIIKTFRGRGYQFIAPLDEAKQPILTSVNKTLQSHSFRLYLLAMIALLAIGFTLYNQRQALTMEKTPSLASFKTQNRVVVEKKSIAVLPFKNHSALIDDEFFTDGIHDDLLTQISKIRTIKTISRTSVMGYRDTTKNIREIGKELGVTTILEGGVQRAGDQIRINIQLINAITDEHLWSETYTRKINVENIFAIQSEIVQAIAVQLETALSLQEQKNINKLPTQNLAALEAYFLAKASARKHTSEGYQEAIMHLQQALKIDPTFSTAYAELGSLQLGQVYWAGLPVEEQIIKARPLIEAAIKLDPKTSAGYVALGTLNASENNFNSAELAYQKAIELNPNNALAYAAYGNFYQWEIRNRIKAVAFLFKAKELNPNDDSLGVNLAGILIQLDRFHEAQLLLEDIINRKPDYAAAYWGLGNIYFYAYGQIAETIHIASMTTRIDPSVPVRAILFAWGYIHLGEKDRAIEWLTYALSLTSNAETILSIQATIHELRGEYNLAFNAYMQISASSAPDIFRLMVLGLKLNRSDEMLERIESLFPTLFQPGAVVDKNNFSTALIIGIILKSKGELMQANHLLAGVLNIAQLRKYEGWGGRYKNWEAQVYLALGDKKSALAAFSKTVEEGFHSIYLVTDSIYRPLFNEPEYQRIIKMVKAEIKKEREKLKELEARGEIVLPSQLSKN